MGLSIGDFSRIKYVGSGSDKGTYDAEFQAASEATGVPVALLKAIADAESDFRNLKPNRCGAAGIMQLIPSTAASLGVSDVQDPAQNIMGGAKYIAQQLEAFDGDVDKALGAYNAGPNNVKNGKYLKFEETRNYIEKINGYLAEGVPEAGKLHGTERKTLPSRNRERKAANVATLLSTARAEVGTTEWPADSNQVKYNDWYYGSNVKGDDYPWCMAFVQWCYKTAGIDLPCKTASCSGLLDWYRKNSPECVVQDPQPGDIAIYDFGHTGIVKSVDGNGITAIEGNTSAGTSGSQSNGGGVFEKRRGKDSVVAYIRPAALENGNPGQGRASSIWERATANLKSFGMEFDKDAYQEYKLRGDVLSNAVKQDAITDNPGWDHMGGGLVGIVVSLVAEAAVKKMEEDAANKAGAERERKRQAERMERDAKVAEAIKKGKYNPADFAFLDTGSGADAGLSL